MNIFISIEICFFRDTLFELKISHLDFKYFFSHILYKMLNFRYIFSFFLLLAKVCYRIFVFGKLCQIKVNFKHIFQCNEDFLFMNYNQKSRFLSFSWDSKSFLFILFETVSPKIFIFVFEYKCFPEFFL